MNQKLTKEEIKAQLMASLYTYKEATPELIHQAQQSHAARPDESEYNHQRRLHVWLKRQGVLHFHPPNELVRSEEEGRAQSLIGLYPGVPDIVIPLARKPHHGLYLELKRDSGIVSAAQAWWIEQLNLAGYLALVSFSFEQSVAIVSDYLKLPPWETAFNS